MAPLSIYLLTFNCACNLIHPASFARHIFDGLLRSSGDAAPASSGLRTGSSIANSERQISSNSSAQLPDILFLSLQEVAPIAHAFLGESFLAPYLDAFKDAVRLAAPDQVPGDEEQLYAHIATRNVGMTALMVFVRSSAGISVSDFKTAGVGVGIQEMGNKGAVGIKMTVSGSDDEDGEGRGETQVTFIAAHLAPTEEGVEDRNENWERIVRGLVFTKEDVDSNTDGDKSKNGNERGEHGEEGEEVAEPLLQAVSEEDGKPIGLYDAKSHIFVAGDLNYRSSDTRPGPDDPQRFPQSTHHLADANHFSKLLKSDQLRHQLELGKTLHGFTEPNVKFPPTYKFSSSPPAAADTDGASGSGKVTSEDQWKWATHRWPSWCDRILYHKPAGLAAGDTDPDRNMIIYNYDALPQQETSDHRPVIMSLSLPFNHPPSIPPPSSPSPSPSPITKAQQSPPELSTRKQTNQENDDDDDDEHNTTQAPFPINHDWKSRRATARRKEVIVGAMAYMALTWQGNGLLVATLLFGSVGAYGLSWMGA